MTPLRLDDLGASSKQYEWWSRYRFANIWPLHHRRLFGAWGPYRELLPWELEAIFRTVDAHGASITVAITACWVERDGTLVPYPRKFPEQAAVVKRWAERGTVEIAAHGLTHCRPGHHLPRWIGGNRMWHREHGGVARVMNHLEQSLGGVIGVTSYVEPGQHPTWPPGCRVWHDREFVLDRTAMARFRKELGCHEYRSIRSWKASQTAAPINGGSS